MPLPVERVMFVFAVIILIAAVMSGDVALAGAFHAAGSGLQSCGSWTASRRAYVPGGPATHAAQTALQEMEWITGFLSGIASQGSLDPLNNVDVQGVWAWIDNYCRAHPLEAIGDAAAAFAVAHPR